MMIATANIVMTKGYPGYSQAAEPLIRAGDTDAYPGQGFAGLLQGDPVEPTEGTGQAEPSTLPVWSSGMRFEAALMRFQAMSPRQDGGSSLRGRKLLRPVRRLGSRPDAGRIPRQDIRSSLLRLRIQASLRIEPRPHTMMSTRVLLCLIGLLAPLLGIRQSPLRYGGALPQARDVRDRRRPSRLRKLRRALSLCACPTCLPVCILCVIQLLLFFADGRLGRRKRRRPRRSAVQLLHP